MPYFLRPILIAALTVGAACFPIGAISFASYLKEWELRAFLKNKTLHGQTAQDREEWQITFYDDSSFKFRYSNGRIARGRWYIKGKKIDLIFKIPASSKSEKCRMIFYNSREELEWQNCKNRFVSSYIVAPRFDPRQYDGLNERKAAEAADALQAMKSVIGELPPPKRPFGRLLAGTVENLLDSEIRRQLSKAGQLKHAEAVQRSLETGERQRWETGRESGFAAPIGHYYTDALGRICKDLYEEVHPEGSTIRKRGIYCWDENGKLDKVATIIIKKTADAGVCFHGTTHAACNDHAPL